jgi:hypothetical protein
MADESAGTLGNGSTLLTKTVRPDLADKYLYFYKLDTWAKDHKAKMLGLEGNTSGTNTKTISTVQTKIAAIKTSGQPNQQRTVLSYFQIGDGIYEDMKKAWRYNITIHLYRLNLNMVTGTAPNRQAPCEYAQCIIGAVPATENLGAIMQASLAFEVQGYAVDSVADESMFDDGAFSSGLALYDFIAPTSAGGSTDASYDGANANAPTSELIDDGSGTDGGADGGGTGK